MHICDVGLAPTVGEPADLAPCTGRLAYADAAWTLSSGRRAARLCRPRGLIAWQQYPGILKEHHAVAEQAPSLLGMTNRHARGRAIRCQCIWAPGLVLAHIVLRH